MDAQAKDDLSIDAILVAVRRSLLSIALIVGLFVAGALVVAFTADRIYRAQVTVVIDTPESGGGLAALASQLGGVAQMAGVALPGSKSRGENMALLESYALAERVVKLHDLLPLLHPAKQGEPPATLWRGVTTFASNVVHVDEDRLTGVVTVAVEWTQPEIAARWANQFVEEANLLARERAVADAVASLEFLRKELANTQAVELRQMLSRLIEAQVNKKMLATVMPDYAFRIIDPAVAPERPVRPRKIFILAAGFVLGCGFAFLLVLFRALRQRQGHV